MRIILKIARAELRSLFFSPIAWAVLVLFYIIACIPVMSIFKMGVVFQTTVLKAASDWKNWQVSLTKVVFGNLYETVINYMYLFIPLLTMGVMNKEVNAGTIKLLYSSPVQGSKIVLGKYLGLLAMVIAMLLPLILFSVTGYFLILQADFKVFFSALLGFFLLGGAYAAIGLFISSLTSHQIVAGVITFVVFFLLHIMGGVWQQYDFVRDLTYFLSMSGRIDNLAKGLMTSKDIIYFLLIISLFLCFSLIKFRSVQEPGSRGRTFFRYVAALVSVLMLGYFSSRPGYIGYLDVTHDQVNTIQSTTRAIVEELGDEPLTVTLYSNLLDGSFMHGLPQKRNNYVWNFWDSYVRFHPNIRFKYIYYYDIKDSDSASFRQQYPKKSFYEVAKGIANTNGMSIARFKSPKEIRSLIDLEPEDKRLVMQLEYKGKKVFLRTFSDPDWPWPREEHVSAAICRLVRNTMPLVLFTSGHYERSPYKMGEREYTGLTTYKLSRTALQNLGVDVDTIRLTEQNIPARTNVLVVADPKSALQPGEKDKIIKYINNGGNAIFYGEPGKQGMLNPVLDPIGVHLDNGTIVQPNAQEMPHILKPALTRAAAFMAREAALYELQLKPSLNLYVNMPGAAAISYVPVNGFTIEPLFNIKGNDSYWIENGLLVTDSAAPKFSAAEGDVRKDHYVTGLKMTRMINGHEQRIVVFSDADFMSGLRLYGGVFGNAGYSWALYNEYPKYIIKPLAADNLFVISESAVKTLYIIYLFVIPAIVLILGTIILIRRNRK